ncbi:MULTISPECIES: helix-turn-helix transcriptional regulator [Enterobacteriaceae]|uniref:helix-turn-helix transcriptional regulator n=1 Tax=Enterobacteriaceae TaxID=543 RepID=UPI000237D26D|nr:MULTISPECIES: helix-turn-helix transcriptional regulator [Enterobacteriaceae]QNE50934.1 helix-turn-helix transcriptional regulator [Klebsiella michiganensis]
MVEEIKNNIQNNLRLLLSSCNSIADMCRKTDINRQQFNKYLAGHHLPSRNTLNKVSRYFNLGPEDLYLSPPKFKALFQSNDADARNALLGSVNFNYFISLANLTSNNLSDYLGVYHRYHYSSIYKGKVLRSVTVIYERDNVVEYSTIERFPLMGHPGKTGYVFRYNGFCFMLGDRIFMIDSEQKQNNEMTFTILTPQYRRPVRYLHGIITGIASTSFRQPFSSRVSLQYSGDSKITRSLIKSATILTDLKGVPEEILNYLDNDGAGILWGGSG